MSDHEARFVERLRDGYEADPSVGADLERRVMARVYEAPRRSPWTWALPAAGMAAVAAALFLWIGPSPSPSDAPEPGGQMASVTPSAGTPPTEMVALVLALEAETEDETDPLPGEYAMLADVWDEEIEL